MHNNGYYSDKNNNLNECKSCDEDNNEGIKCSDEQILISENYWMGFDGDNIISAACPSGYCCQQASGCDYLFEDKSILCAENRDYKSILCGKCKDGYSESMNTVNCTKCKRKYYFEYLIYLSVQYYYRYS